MSKPIGHLIYDRDIDRFIFIGRLGYERPLHCGDTLSYLKSENPDVWFPTRIEYSDDWYLVDTDLKGNALLSLIVELNNP